MPKSLHEKWISQVKWISWISCSEKGSRKNSPDFTAMAPKLHHPLCKHSNRGNHPTSAHKPSSEGCTWNRTQAEESKTSTGTTSQLLQVSAVEIPNCWVLGAHPGAHPGDPACHCLHWEGGRVTICGNQVCASCTGTSCICSSISSSLTLLPLKSMLGLLLLSVIAVSSLHY